MGHSEIGSTLDERTLIPSLHQRQAAETLPGSAVGTPAYMSPEAAAGDLDHLGPRSDVYSLGATLYCLLTGKAPFEGTDMGSVLRMVQKGDFPRPRTVDASIDPGLEAVCLKAMARKAEDRYPSTKALADDIERWMADEPVTATTDPVVVRLSRWGRRHRPLVAGARGWRWSRRWWHWRSALPRARWSRTRLDGTTAGSRPDRPRRRVQGQKANARSARRHVLSCN